MKVMPWFFLLTSSLLILALSVLADAAVVINVQQSGNDVVATASGTFNMASLTAVGGCNCGGLVGGTAWGGPGASVLAVGIPSAEQQAWSGDITGPFPFSTGPIFVGTSGSESPVGIAHLPGSSDPTVLYTAVGYPSGSPLTGDTTWANQTISSMGLIPGSYRYTWGAALTADSLTINIVPEPTAVGLAALGGAALMIFRGRIF
jgi:hypothetical protein